MGVAEVAGLEGVGGAVGSLIRLWKCVEKFKDGGSRHLKIGRPRRIPARGISWQPTVVNVQEIKCGAARLTNSRALTTFVAFQNLGKWRKFPVIR